MSYTYRLETGLRFRYKRDALLTASLKNPPTPVYLETGVDISAAATERTIPIHDVFIEECHWLKEQNDKIVIAYSGGSDSYFRIQHFIEAGIPIDEIVVVDGSLGRQIPDPIPTTWDYTWCEAQAVAIPYLKEYSKQFPKTKITVLKVEDYLHHLPKTRNYVNSLKQTRFLSRGLQGLACPGLYEYDVPVIPGYTLAGYADANNVYLRFSDRVHNPQFSHGSPRFLVQYMRAMYESYLQKGDQDIDTKYHLYGYKPDIYRADKPANHSDPKKHVGTTALEMARLPEYQEEFENQAKARAILSRGIHPSFIREDGILQVTYMRAQPVFAGAAMSEFISDPALGESRFYLAS